MFRRLLAISGICIILLSAGSGAYTLSVWRAHHIARNEASAYRKNGQGEKLIIPRTEFAAMPKEEIRGGIVEIYYHGEKYDVLQVVNEQDANITLIVFNDSYERSLHADLEKKKNGDEQTIPFFGFYFYQQSLTCISADHSGVTIYTRFKDHLQGDPLALCATPPPEIFCIG